jgi:hypothetical protein
MGTADSTEVIVDGTVTAQLSCHESASKQASASTSASPERGAAAMRISSPMSVSPAPACAGQPPLPLSTAEEQFKTLPGESIALHGRAGPLLGDRDGPALPQQDAAIHDTLIVEGRVPTALGSPRRTGQQCESIAYAFPGYTPAIVHLASTTLPPPLPSIPQPELAAQDSPSAAATSPSATGSPKAPQGPLESATPQHHDVQQHVSHLLGIMDPSTTEKEALTHSNVSCIRESAPSVQAALPSGKSVADLNVPVASHDPATGAIDPEGPTPGALEESGPAAEENRAEEGAEAEEGRAGDGRATHSGKTFSAGTHHCAPSIEHAGLILRDRHPRVHCDKADVPAKHAHGGPMNPVAMQTESEDSDSSLPSLSLADLLGEMNK